MAVPAVAPLHRATSGWWYYNRALGTWLWLSDADLSDYPIDPRCRVRATESTAPGVPPPGCPPRAGAPGLTVIERLNLRISDDLRDYQLVPELTHLSRALAAMRPETGSLMQAATDLHAQIESSTDLVRGLARELFRDALGSDLQPHLTRILFPEAAKLPVAEAAFRPNVPRLSDASVLVERTERLATAITGRRPPPTPQLRPRGRGPGAWKLPGCNPTYPTNRGKYPGAEPREAFALLYGRARWVCEHCASLAQYQRYRDQVPRGFHKLYSMGYEDAFQLLAEIELRFEAAMVADGYDYETCRKPGEPPPSVPEAPPPPVPPAPPAPVTFATYLCAYSIGGPEEPLQAPILYTIPCGADHAAYIAEVLGVPVWNVTCTLTSEPCPP